jgi:putative membrane protein
MFDRGHHEEKRGGGGQGFLQKAAQGGLAEVELGKLAEERASNRQVRAFAKRMVDDHSKANDDLKRLASRKGVKLPTSPDASHEAVRDRLAKLSGAAFDRAYMDEMTSDHDATVEAFRRASRSAEDPDVRAFATRTLPTLEEHQKEARRVQGAVASAESPGRRAGGYR